MKPGEIPEGVSDAERRIRPLLHLSIAGLEEMFDKNRLLFCNRLSLNKGRLIKEGDYSVRYTIISLLGLQAAEKHGLRSSIDVEASTAAAMDHLRNKRELGETGLYLWLCSAATPDRLPGCCRELSVVGLWRDYAEYGPLKTMEMAWFLAGLAHAAASPVDIQEDLQKLAGSVFKKLKENYCGKGVFGHQGARAAVGWIRRRVGSFADQVYPIYALSQYGSIMGDKEAVAIALDCARHICSTQGALGQWWWHYDMYTGKVLGRYPVYSVHQDGMAPMALFAIGGAAGADFRPAVYRGLDWITGKNELNCDLVNPPLNVIWRCLYQGKRRRYTEEILSLLNLSRRDRDSELKILFECRPYHLGWLLYALAGSG
ncbi:MAG: hypothetical protein ACE14T_02550 [Syntrophales bacterium]